MRVLHVDTAREWRGGQTQMALLALAQPGCAVALPPDAPLVPHLRGCGTDVRPVAFVGRGWGTAALRRVVEDFRPDLVAVHTSHALAHADRLGVRTVVHRRLDFAPSRRTLARMRRAAGVIAVSGAIARVLGARGIHRVEVVYDGVAWPRTPVAAVGLPRPLVVAVGALVPHKGHAVLVDALSWLPGVHAAVLGEGPLRAALRRRADRLGVSGRLHLPGHVADPGAWRRAADVVVHPSLEEGLGQAVVEALLEGAAVVATRAGGVPEVVEDLGLLVPPGQPDALAGVIAAALTRRDELRGRARGAHADLVARFGAGRMVRDTEAVYERCLDQRR